MMKDKISKRVKVDYKALIKGHGLWSVYKRFRRSHAHIKSDRRIMYCFCKSWLPFELKEAINVETNLQENIRLAKDHSWISED